MLAPWHWHIEISSKCTLKCPRCARQEVPDTLVNTQLNLDFFEKNFTKDFILNHVEKITFCGDDGDPIYAHDFIKVVKYFKTIKPSLSIVIVTNGSYKSHEWWTELSEHLTDVDQVHFSLDGWDQESNAKYRVNSDWDSILIGVGIINKSKAFTSWDAIAFKFNEYQLEFMKSKARRLGFDQFQLTKSTKFGKIYPSYGDNDELQPSEKYMSQSHRFERTITNLSGKSLKEPWLNTNLKFYESVKNIENIKPICHIGNKGLYINAKGEFYPCCWVANRYGHNNKWLALGKSLNLYDNNLQDVLNMKFWEKDFIKESYECSTKCSTERVEKNYATEW